MYVGVALVWLVVLAKLPAALRGWRDRGRLNYWLAIFFLAVCITADRELVYRAIAALTGVPNLAHGLSYGAAVVGGYCGQVFLLHSYDSTRLDREVLWRRVVLAVGLAAYVVLFALGPAQLPSDPGVPHLAATRPADAGFRVVLAVLLCWSIAEVSWLAWRFSAAASHRPLRAGMRLVSLGCALIVVRLAVEYGGFALWSAASGWRQSWSYSGALFALNVVALWGAALVALGTALPTLDRHRQAVGVMLARHAACRQLRPLWQAVRSVTPSLSDVLQGEALAPWARLPGLADRPYRMAAEIRDGYVVLSNYRDQQAEQQWRRAGAASGLHGADLDAYVDAGGLQHALRRRARGHRSEDPPKVGVPAAGSSIDAELDHLVRVARWWKAAPSGGVPEVSSVAERAG